MWSIAYGLFANFRRANRKHPSFPENVANSHTTYLSMAQRRDYYRRMNDSGRESMTSVLNEEVSELLCDIQKRRWRRAEKEWMDVIVVLIRIYLVIRRRKKERFDEVMSRIRYRRMLERWETRLMPLPFADCSLCPHNISTGVAGVCSIGNCSPASGVCPMM